MNMSTYIARFFQILANNMSLQRFLQKNSSPATFLQTMSILQECCRTCISCNSLLKVLKEMLFVSTKPVLTTRQSFCLYCVCTCNVPSSLVQKMLVWPIFLPHIPNYPTRSQNRRTFFRIFFPNCCLGKVRGSFDEKSFHKFSLCSKKYINLDIYHFF